MMVEEIFRALASGRRLQILRWLAEPRRHFPPQVEGGLVRDGVCGLLIARKLRVSHPTASEHLKILSQAGLIRGRRIKQWTLSKRDEKEIQRIKKLILAEVYNRTRVEEENRPQVRGWQERMFRSFPNAADALELEEVPAVGV